MSAFDDSTIHDEIPEPGSPKPRKSRPARKPQAPPGGNLITVIRSLDPAKVHKVYGPNRKEDGRLDGHAVAHITSGTAVAYDASTTESMIALLRDVTEQDTDAIVPGAWHGTVAGDTFAVITEKGFKKATKGQTLAGVFGSYDDGSRFTARLKEFISPSVWVLFDFDNPPGIPPEWAALDIEQRLQLLEPIIPGVSTRERIELRSGSSRLLNGAGPGPFSHALMRVSDPGKIETLREHVKVQMVLQGLSFPSPRRSKTETNEDGTRKVIGNEHRTVIDLAVWVTGRLVFVSRPEIAPGVEGYSIAPADVRIVNKGGGVLDLSQITTPEPDTLKSYKDKTGIDLQYTRKGDSLMSEVHGLLTLATEIECRGVVKPLRDWIKDKKAGFHLRCEAPFRDSRSEAAFIKIGPDGQPFVFDVGNSTKYLLGPSQATRKALAAAAASTRVRQTGQDAPPPQQDDAGGDETVEVDPGAPQPEETLLQGALGYVAGELQTFMPEIEPLVNESALPFLNQSAIEQAARTSVYASKSGRIITHTGSEILEFGPIEWARLLPNFLGDVIIDRVEWAKKLKETVEQRKLTKTESTVFKRRAEVAPCQFMADYLKINSQCQTAAFSVDMFITEPCVRMDNTRARFTVPFKKLDESGARDDVAADFAQHFPEFHDFLRFLLMARFAADRRYAYIWLHAPSNWGKALLTSALERIGVLFELTVPLIEKALRGDAVGFDPLRAMYGWCMFVDEFNKASAELKQLNRTMSMSAKWQMQTEIDLFTKLFASKEEVRSLVGNGAEEQFNNRFSLITGTGDVNTRPLMQQIGGGGYVRGLAGYIAKVLNAGVAEMRALGRVEAEMTAQRWLEAFQAKHKLSTTHGNLADTLQDVASSITDVLVHFGQYNRTHASTPPRIDLFLRDNAAVRYTKDFGQVLRVKRLAEFVTNYIEASASRQSAAQLSYRAQEIADLIDQRERTGMGRVRLFYQPDCMGKGEQEKGALVRIPNPMPKPAT